MVKEYLALAQTDLAAAHRKASPVMKWKLGSLGEENEDLTPIQDALKMNGNSDQQLPEMTNLFQQLGERDREELLVLAQTKVRLTNGR